MKFFLTFFFFTSPLGSMRGLWALGRVVAAVFLMSTSFMFGLSVRVKPMPLEIAIKVFALLFFFFFFFFVAKTKTSSFLAGSDDICRNHKPHRRGAEPAGHLITLPIGSQVP